MKLIVRVAVVALLSAILMSSLSYAEPHHGHHQKVQLSGVESLSPELRGLLKEEMLALQSGMMAIIPAYISGNWGEIERLAHQMKNSYILKQSLTDEQIKELYVSLPEAFIKQDQQFHYLAGMLEHAAKNEKVELVGFYFSKLNESCVSCHTQHVTHKFPALAPKIITGKHLH